MHVAADRPLRWALTAPPTRSHHLESIRGILGGGWATRLVLYVPMHVCAASACVVAIPWAKRSQIRRRRRAAARTQNHNQNRHGRCARWGWDMQNDTTHNSMLRSRASW